MNCYNEEMGRRTTTCLHWEGRRRFEAGAFEEALDMLVALRRCTTGSGMINVNNGMAPQYDELEHICFN